MQALASWVWLLYNRSINVQRFFARYTCRGQERLKGFYWLWSLVCFDHVRARFDLVSFRPLHRGEMAKTKTWREKIIIKQNRSSRVR